MQDFAAGSNSWFEPAREFVTLLNRAEYAVKEGNLESQKDFLEKIGSNFILKERRLNFSTEASFRPFFETAPYPYLAVFLRRNQNVLPPNSSDKFLIYQRLGAQTCIQALELISF